MAVTEAQAGEYINAAHREMNQGNAWTYNTEPAWEYTANIVNRGADGTVKEYYQRNLVLQWKYSVYLRASYKYVGIPSKEIAEKVADIVNDAYNVGLERYALKTENYGTAEAPFYATVWDEVGASYRGLTPCATATPLHAAGPLWEVEVAVDAAFDGYGNVTYNSATHTFTPAAPPDPATMRSKLSAVADFPEIAKGS